MSRPSLTGFSSVSFLFCFYRVANLRCNITSSVAQAQSSNVCVEVFEQSVLCPFRSPLWIPPHLLLLPSYFFPPDPPLSLKFPILVQLPLIRFSSTFPVLFSTPLPFFSPSGVPENIGPESYEWHERSGISKSFIICSGVVCVCVCMCVCFGYTGWLAQGAQEFPNHSRTRNGRITEAERKRLHLERPAVAQVRF